jgi:hypothetical protein
MSTNALSIEDESYAMANLWPRDTGVSRHIFVSPRMGSHDIRIKVSATPGKNTIPTNCAVIGLRPKLRHVAGPSLPGDVMDELQRWVGINLDALVAYWDGNISTLELAAKLKKI